MMTAWNGSSTPSVIVSISRSSGGGREGFSSVSGSTLGCTVSGTTGCGVPVVSVIASSEDDWDRYEASQWITGRRWLEENPDDPDAAALRAWLAKNRRAYLEYGRRYLGWGVFVLRPASH